jgi:poly(A) polymerase
VHPKIFSYPDHPIDRSLIDPHALTTIETLQQAGHTAYLVGGGVRDLLMGLHPKDFDISTSARPDEIKRLFHRQCLLIGKRFRLAHIRFGNKIFEVSTFRAGDPNSSSLIVHDNHWGTEDEDVLRRDFTMNALFYDPTKETILDYVGGVEDVKRGLLKTIGDPETRFRQDPVRMIRMLKFQARFGFRCDEKAVTAMRRCRREILKSAPARVLEELFKMLESGKAELFFLLMTDHGFIELIFPCFHHFFAGPTREIAASYLRAVDEIRNRPGGLAQDRSVLLAAIVFPILEEELRTLSWDRQGPISVRDIAHLAETLLHGITISSFVHFPKRLLGNLYLTLVNQFRMTPLTGQPKYHIRFHSHEDRFLALELLKIRALVQPELGSVCDQWEATIAQHSHHE